MKAYFVERHAMKIAQLLVFAGGALICLALTGCAHVKFEARYDDGSFVSGSGWALGTKLDSSLMSSHMEWENGKGMMSGSSDTKSLSNEESFQAFLDLIAEAAKAAP